MFDLGRPPVAPLPAATVILVRDRGDDVEVYLVRRHRASGFMANAFVFPGGKIDTGEDAEAAALRELFEEAGVLLTTRALEAPRRADWRARLLGGTTTFAELLASEGLELDLGKLHPWARWVTPSVEPRRFDARFFVAELPAGQTPSFDDKETVEERWLTPGAALEQHAAGALKLPPPQLRVLSELPAGGLAAVIGASRVRREHLHPICPRFAQLGETMALLLPWDPAYASGVGEGAAVAADSPIAAGPSRFLLEGTSWRLTHAPR